MTLQPSDLATGSLYATFYVDNQQPAAADELATCLIKQFTLKLKEVDFWQNDADSIFLHRFALMNDTLGMQIILNDTPPWATAYRDLNRLLHQLQYSCLQHIWGYTLIYQAHVAVTATVNLDKVDLNALLDQLEPLGQPGRAPRHPIAHSRLKWGHLWLLEIPNSGEGIDAAMLYLALSPTEQQAENLATQTLMDTILLPDLITHKGYHQIRQYKQQPTYDNLKKKLNSMRQNAAALLRQAQPTAFGLPDESGQITHITQNYAELVATNQPDLHKWHIALSKQDENYPTLWQLESKGGGRSEINLNITHDVFTYHQSRIKIGLRELEFLMTEAENAQAVTQTAMEATRTASELRREKLQEWFNLILAVVGLGLTLAQLITDDLAKILPTHLGYAEATTPLAQLGVKLFVMGILALVILAIWVITNYRNSKK